MRHDDRTACTIVLAERGLEIESFDGCVLLLSYVGTADVDAEAGKAARIPELARFAANLLNQLPDACLMFPGLNHIEVLLAQKGTTRRVGPRSSAGVPQCGVPSAR